MQQTTFVSLYQAGEGIYQQFDKVLVLNESHVVYFGPSTEARQYMVGLGYKDLPRQTSADYLSGCTDPNERQFADGKDVDSVPSTPERMEEAYRQSDIYRRMMVEKDEYKKHMAEDERHREEFRQAVHEQKQKGVRTKSPYTAPFISQVWAITKRQTILKFQDKFGIYTGYGTSIVIALIVGSVYFRLPTSASGAFTRGGLLFLGLLFNVSPSTSIHGQITELVGSHVVLRAARSDDGSPHPLPSGRLQVLPSLRIRRRSCRSRRALQREQHLFLLHHSLFYGRSLLVRRRVLYVLPLRLHHVHVSHPNLPRTVQSLIDFRVMARCSSRSCERSSA
jgi:hypothetical protein